jgi:hypothetical protein
MITTSGCRPIAVGDATLRLSVMRFEEREWLEVLLLNESYAMLIPEDEGVFVGMGARKTVRMRRSSKSHVRLWLARTRW